MLLWSAAAAALSCETTTQSLTAAIFDHAVTHNILTLHDLTHGGAGCEPKHHPAVPAKVPDHPIIKGKLQCKPAAGRNMNRVQAGRVVRAGDADRACAEVGNRSGVWQLDSH